MLGIWISVTSERTRAALLALFERPALSILLLDEPTRSLDLVGAAAIVLGIVFKNMNVSYLVGWAFSVAASANLPSLVMLLFWKGVTRQGVIAAVLTGMFSSLGWILLSGDTYAKVYGLSAEDALTPFSQPGIVTIPLGFATLIGVSLLTGGKSSD